MLYSRIEFFDKSGNILKGCGQLASLIVGSNIELVKDAEMVLAFSQPPPGSVASSRDSGAHMAASTTPYGSQMHCSISEELEDDCRVEPETETAGDCYHEEYRAIRSCGSKMGNSESQYTIQHSHSSKCIIPDRLNHYSSKNCSTGDGISLPCGDRNAGLRFRTPSKSDHTFTSRNYEYITRKLKSRVNGQRNEVSDGLFREGDLLEKSGTGEKSKGCHYYAFNTLKTTRRSISLQDFEKQSSPRVVIKKDDTGRVDFNHVSDSAFLSDQCSGPVQLLRFSPTIESSSDIFGVTPSLVVNLKAQQPVGNFKRTKGSSSTSDDSLYDLPWTCVEPNDSDITFSNRETQSISTRKLGVFAQKSPDITIADLCKDPKIDATFLRFSNDSPLNQRTSFVSGMEESGLEGCQGEKQYSFFTLPCQKPKPVLESTRKSETIMNKFRHIRNFTGSLTRKKKKLQEPNHNEPTDCFDSGVDGLTADTSSPSQVSSLLGVSSGTSQTHSQSQALQFCSRSDGALLLDTDTLQNNIYKNFMKELMAGQTSAEGGVEESGENFTDETESSSQETLGSLKQLDLLFEKEQGVVRRAGWLHFKPLLSVHKDRKLELVGHRKWKKFWVTLKGCTLLFYDSYGKAFSDQELSPCCALLADDGIVQAVPEHPKKENVFCLSNVYGDVYLFQASNQTDLENWVTAIHSACASLFAKRNGKEDTLRLLHGEIRGILQKIDMDSKMKKMAELHLPIVGNPKNRKAIEDQIQQWEQNLERFNIDLFRMRCYLASRQGGELPNPKTLLATANRSSKAAVARLGIFSVSSFHALLKGLDPYLHCLKLRRCVEDRMEIFAPPAHELLQDLSYDDLEVCQLNNFTLHISRPNLTVDFGYVDSNRYTHITVSEVPPNGLAFRKGLRPGDEIWFLNGFEVSSLDLALIPTLFNNLTVKLTVKRPLPSIQYHTDTNTRPLNRNCLKNHHRAKSSKVVYKRAVKVPDVMFQCCVWDYRSASMAEPCIFLSTLFEHILYEHSPTEVLCLFLTMCWFWAERVKERKDVFLNLSIPTLHRLAQNKMARLRKDIAACVTCWNATEESVFMSVDTVCSLYQNYQEDSGILMEGQREPRGPGPSMLRPYPWQMSATERLCKVIQELVDTEKSYVKMESLFGSLPEMLSFQKVFLLTLEEKISSSPNFTILETPVQFKKLLFSLGGSFLYYAEHFKLYCGFCANHIKVQKVLARAKTDRSFKEFLDARNPTMQHSTTLESYLIKPVQRVLKYPLLLRELVSLTDIDSEEHYHLTEALKEMEKVASHINEMQKIYEDYGAVFDQLVAEQNSTEKEPTSRSAQGNQVPFELRWLIPLSALQIRLGNTGETGWELIHTKSEKVGRPETVFQLCSSTLKCKLNIIKAIRSILRENLRQNMNRTEQPTERTCKKRLSPLRKTLPASAKLGSSRASWLCKKTSNDTCHSLNDLLRHALPDSDSTSSSSLTTSNASAPLDPPSDLPVDWTGLKESIIDEENECCERNERQDSQLLGSAVETKFQKLQLTEKSSQGPSPCEETETEVDTPERQAFIKRAHICAMNRTPGRGSSNSFRREQVSLGNMRRHSHSLDSQTESMANNVDLNSLLEQDFSVQSLTSVVNEDIFYDNTTEAKNGAATTS
ncbi:T-lymphoma invasion and metastasis-inducing protein 2 [Triplophysa tibetana]|uniref:T-lymphoma invasion and metastasis-inducing protein 2 n=1 Tax=Triplophysa tibetana TaxID=1572043 RepID=A0A5A9NRC3_9TELE|nr:T-lymphoma invasion and metastasis-inducing protein 2 [Triplophysa tibetana]